MYFNFAPSDNLSCFNSFSHSAFISSNCFWVSSLSCVKFNLFNSSKTFFKSSLFFVVSSGLTTKLFPSANVFPFILTKTFLWLSSTLLSSNALNFISLILFENSISFKLLYLNASSLTLSKFSGIVTFVMLFL